MSVVICWCGQHASFEPHVCIQHYSNCLFACSSYFCRPKTHTTTTTNTTAHTQPHTHTQPQPQALFDSILAGLLARVRDHNGRVQEAACSGLAEVMEHAGHCTNGQILVQRYQVKLTHRIEVETVSNAYPFGYCVKAVIAVVPCTCSPTEAPNKHINQPAYQHDHPTNHSTIQAINDALSSVVGSCGRRNLRIMLDAVTTSIDTVGRGHARQQTAAIQQLMVPLFQRWQQPGLAEQVCVFLSG